MKHGGQYFRAGVGAMITDGAGHVLAFERSDMLNQWQMPQGGLKRHEEPLEAAFREIQEETGLRSSQLELVGNYPDPLAYELPSDAKNRKTGRGQVQYWFLFKLKETSYQLDPSQSREFRASRWTSMDKLIDEVVRFRKPVYSRLAEYFSNQLTSTVSAK